MIFFKYRKSVPSGLALLATALLVSCATPRAGPGANLAGRPPASRNVIIAGNPEEHVGGRVESIQLSPTGRLPVGGSNRFFTVVADWP